MLIITRRTSEVVRLKLEPTIDPSTPVGEIFSGGPIEVLVAQVRDDYVQLGVSAPPAFLVLRKELDVIAKK